MENPIYIDKPTKLHKLHNISKILNSNIYIKREDQSKYLCNGGNKCRKLEYIMGHTLDNNYDTIITCGAVQSNHCMLTTSAAKKEGLDCYIVLEERVNKSYNEDASGNNYLYELLGAKKILTTKGNTKNRMKQLNDELKEQGKNPIIVPGGGSYPIENQGYIDCANEIIEYGYQNNIHFDYIFVCSGSGGTHAGLHVGFKYNNYNTKVIGISNNLSKKEQIDRIYKQSTELVNYLNLDIEIKKEEIYVDDSYVGKGYSLETDGMKKALKLFAQKEGILLDAVYTGKCADGVIDYALKEGKNKNILFVHTGGATNLFHYKPI